MYIQSGRKEDFWNLHIIISAAFQLASEHETPH
jgi:hypothetical protein